MVYRVEITSGAQAQIDRLDKSNLGRIENRIAGLASNPRPQGAKRLAGHASLWRIRQGDYRIIYTIQDSVVLVTVLRVGHRSTIYERT